MKRIFSALILSFSLGHLQAASTGSYVFTDLGALSIRDRMAACQAYAINAGGTVSGFTQNVGAFLYDGRVHLLPGDASTSAILALDMQGQGAGFISVDFGGISYSHAALYSNGSMNDLGTLGGQSSFASGINSTGDVVGSSSTSGNSDSRAFLYKNGSMTNLGTLGGLESSASGINDAGQIVGTSMISGGAQHAFLYQNGTMSDLGTLGGGNSFATAINNAGQIVGHAMDAAGNLHAFLYVSGSMQRILKGDRASYAYAINTSGQIVGTFRDAKKKDGAHAFLYSKGLTLDLQTLLAAGTKWKLETAVGINDAGQIIGNGRVYYSPTRSAARAFLLTPAHLAPKLRLTGVPNITTSQPMVTIHGRGIGKITSLSYYKDGNASKSYPISGTKSWRFQTHLHSGKNTFTIRAHGSRGDSAPLVVTVVRS
jgi:probable HAF family extracellular repeat protein